MSYRSCERRRNSERNRRGAEISSRVDLDPGGTRSFDIDPAQYGPNQSALIFNMYPPFPYAAFFWPALAAASAGEMSSFIATQLQAFPASSDNGRSPEPEGVTPGTIALELNTVRLHDFTAGESGVPTLLCTPLALHGAAVADLVAGHSLVAALRSGGIERLFRVDWRTASPGMRFLGIDDYLADLNVLVDHVGGFVDLIGLCQGGWLSLIYAARFPAKVRKLVLAGSPIDIAAQRSSLSAMVDVTPMAFFEGLVTAGGGRVIGRSIARLCGSDIPDAGHVRRSLQTPEPVGSPEFGRLQAAFDNWNSWTLDLPGTYYLEVIEKFYKANQLANGSFVALGQKIDLKRLLLPIFLLAGDADELVAPQQLFALTRLVGTEPESLRCELAPSDHLGLFMGKKVLEEYWPKIAHWIGEPPSR